MADRPTDRLQWHGAQAQPSAPQKAAGFAIEQNPPAQTLNWLLGNVGEWVDYFDGYINETYPPALASARLAAVESIVYPLRPLVDVSAMQMTSLSAYVDGSGVLQELQAVGAAGKTVRYDPATQTITPSTWGIAADISDICRASDRFAACGATGKLRVSDLLGWNWSPYADLGGTSLLRSIAYSPELNVFAACGSDATGANSAVISGNGVNSPVTRALSPASDTPWRIVWAGGPIQKFFAFALGRVHSSPNPYTTPFTQIYTYSSSMASILDACWHPDLGLIMLGAGATQLRVVWSVDGNSGSWDTASASAMPSPFNGALVALPQQLTYYVSFGSAYAASAFSRAADLPPYADFTGSTNKRLGLAARPARAKVLHNAIYLAANRNATDSTIYVSAPLEALRPYAIG